MFIIPLFRGDSFYYGRDACIIYYGRDACIIYYERDACIIYYERDACIVHDERDAFVIYYGSCMRMGTFLVSFFTQTSRPSPVNPR